MLVICMMYATWRRLSLVFNLYRSTDELNLFQVVLSVSDSRGYPAGYIKGEKGDLGERVR